MTRKQKLEQIRGVVDVLEGMVDRFKELECQMGNAVPMDVKERVKKIVKELEKDAF